jgi:transketolase
LARQIRLHILEESFRAHKGHIGSCLSIADIAAALVRTARGITSCSPDRDRVILSKGHAALAWYAALCAEGYLARDVLAGYATDGSLLGTHPDCRQLGIDFSTGSLGQGIGFGVGCALASQIRGDSFRTFVVLSDAELNEGSTWESLLLAAHLSLSTLTVVLDDNGQQALGQTRRILGMGDLFTYLNGLGWNVLEIDGHDPDVLAQALESTGHLGPRLFRARTVSGRGVSFMEGSVDWHYLPLSTAQHAQAKREVGAEE